MNKSTKQVIPLLIYALAYVVYTFPLILNVNSEIIGRYDIYQTIFNVHVFANNLTSLSNPLYTDWMYYPFGTGIIFNTNVYLLGLFAFPFSNLALAINLYLFIQFLLAGFGAFRLGNHFLKDYRLSILVGFIFAFSSYQMNHLQDHINLVSVGLVPFLILEYLYFLKDRKKIRILTFSILLFVNLLAGYVVTFLTLFVIGFHFLGLMWKEVKQYLPNTSIWLNLIIIVVAILGIDQLVQVLLRSGISTMGIFYWAPNVEELISPRIQRLYVSWLGISDGPRLDKHQYENILFVSFTLIGLSIVSISKYRSFKGPITSLFFPTLASFLFIFPKISFFDTKLLYSPSAIFSFIPLINNNRIPARYYVVFILLFSILVLYGLSKTQFYKRHKTTLVPIVFLCLFLEFLPVPFKQKQLNNPSETYQALRQLDGEGLLALPLGFKSGTETLGAVKVLHYSNASVHQKKLMGGYTSRFDVPSLQRQLENPFIAKLIELEGSDKVDYDLSKVTRGISKEAIGELDLDLLLIPEGYKNTLASQFVLEVFHDDIVDSINVNGDGIYILADTQR